jgi:hypothetical protein
MPQGLSSPSARLQGLVTEGERDEANLFSLFSWVSDENVAEVEFTEGEGGLESFLASSCTWMDFLSFTNNKAAWLDEQVLVFSGHNNAERIWACHFFMSIEASFGSGPNPTRTFPLNIFALPSSWQATNICDALLLQLLVRSQPSRVYLKSLGFDNPLTISGLAIQGLLEQCPGLELLTFMDTTLDESQCRALAAASPSTTTGKLDIRFHGCRVLNVGSTAALADLFRDNNNNSQTDQVHYHLDHFQTEGWRVLAESLRGNTSVKTIYEPGGLYGRQLKHDEFRVLAEALRDNQGLGKFTPRRLHINDENWTLLCQSLRSHPTLDTLDLSGTFHNPNAGMTNASKKHRCTCIVNLLRSNTVLSSVHLTRDERDETIWRESIVPHLQTRTYHPLVREIKAVADQPRRFKLFGRALNSVKTKPHLLYLFVIGSVDIITASHEARSRAPERRSIVQFLLNLLQQSASVWTPTGSLP